MHRTDSIEYTSLIFKGFREFEIKYLKDEKLESDFEKYGFFPNELRKVVSETDLILKYIPTVNYHLIKPCNMKCNHCFSDFEEIKINQLSLENAIQIIDQISSVQSFKKLNFSGGEPTLFKGIEHLIKYAKEKGLETSMVTNGYKLINTPDLFDCLIGYLDLLVLSIDGFETDLNLKIGRHVGKQTLSFENIKYLVDKCHDCDIKIKINTVVTRLNYDQDLATKIRQLRPIRWKVFRMLPVTNQNEKANLIHPSDDEFQFFLKSNKSEAEKFGIKVVPEDNNEMTGSYIMISPDGKFFNNVEGEHKYSDAILEVGIKKALDQTPLLREVFYKREGEYTCM